MTKESQKDHINNKSDEISLKELVQHIQEWWKYFLSKWIVILIFGLLGGALGITYSLLNKPVYIASSTFVLEEDRSGGMGSLAGLASVAGVDLGTAGGSLFQGDNIQMLYKSKKMIKKTLFSFIQNEGKNELLIEQYIQFNKLRDKWNSKLELRDIKFSVSDINQTLRVRDSLVGMIVDDIYANYLEINKPDKKLSFIKVTVKSKDELFSKNFNEQIVKNVNDFYVETKTKKSKDNVAILQHKTDSVRRMMNADIYAAVAVADATPNLNPTRQVQRVAPAQRSQFSAETNKAVLSEMLKNLEMSKIALLKETPLIQQVDNPILPLETVKFGKTKGIIMGGLLFGFLALIFLILKRIYKNILNE